VIKGEYVAEEVRFIYIKIYKVSGIKNRRIKTTATFVILAGAAGTQVHLYETA
jgi:hypothetical protein